MSVFKRREFLHTSIGLSAFPLTGLSKSNNRASKTVGDNRFKLSLNAYSFNGPLTSGKTNLREMISFCSMQGFAAADLTGYYFPGYPQVPTDDYIYALKRHAHSVGIAISGTGIRNDFTVADKSARQKDIVLIKNWIEVAAKLGAPVIRIFSGKAIPDKNTWNKVAEWMVEDIKTCVEYGKQHGVIVAVQNHNDFLKTVDETIGLIKRVDSEWFGLVLDTGHFATNDPFDEIAKLIPYAVNWQVKEKLNYNGKTEDMDLTRLFKVIKSSNYRGYLPIETLSPGDPFQIVPPFLKQVLNAMENS